MSYRLIDHEPEGRTDKVSAMRGHSVAEGATSAPVHFSDTTFVPVDVRLWGHSGKHLLAAGISHFDPNRTSTAVEPKSRQRPGLYGAPMTHPGPHHH